MFGYNNSLKKVIDDNNFEVSKLVNLEKKLVGVRWRFIED